MTERKARKAITIPVSDPAPPTLSAVFADNRPTLRNLEDAIEDLYLEGAASSARISVTQAGGHLNASGSRLELHAEWEVSIGNH